MSIQNKLPFPNEWNKNNSDSVLFYNKCEPYVETYEELNNLTNISLFFKIFGISVIIIILFINIWLFTYHNNYVFRRQCRKYYIFLMIGSSVVLTDTYLLEV